MTTLGVELGAGLTHKKPSYSCAKPSASLFYSLVGKAHLAPTILNPHEAGFEKGIQEADSVILLSQ